jgi:general secretion pathway protein B
MSFILDALKKSENERQRKVGPSLADVHVRSPESKKPWWAVAIAALLLINLVVLIVALTRDRSSASVQATSAATATVQPQSRNDVPFDSTAPAQSSASEPTKSPAPGATSAAVHPLAEEAGVAPPESGGPGDAPNPSLAAAALPPDGPPMVRPIDDPAAPANSTATFGARTQEPPQPQEVLPTASELVANGTQLPELHLDIHVYSANPAERFVFVNMHKYVEGQSLSEGPTVERITPEGVILNHQGLRFLLPRP